MEGLKNKKPSGLTPKLSLEKLAFIKELVLNHSPTAYSYNTQIWIGALLIDWIKTTYEVEYKETQIYSLLKKLGLSYQKSKGYFPQANSQIKVIFKPELKKTL